MSKSTRSHGDGWKIFGICILILLVLAGIVGLVVYGLSREEEEEETEVFDDDDTVNDPSYHVHHWEYMNDSVNHWLYCSLCNQVDSDSFESHNFDSIMVVYPANYEDGYTEYTCIECGYTFQDVILWDDKYLPEPDPEEPGDLEDPDGCDHSYIYRFDDVGHWYQCELCGEVLEDSEESHSLDLCSDSSGHYYHCDVCGYNSTVTSHSFTSNYDDSNHWSECKTCGYKTNVESHSKVSVTSNGSSGHTYKCSCGYIYASESHSYAASWYADSNDNHYHYCSVCGYAEYHHDGYYVHYVPKEDNYSTGFLSSATYWLKHVTFSPYNNSTYKIYVPCYNSDCRYTLTIATLVSYQVASGFSQFCDDFYDLACKGKGAMKSYYKEGFYDIGSKEHILEYYDVYLNNYLDDYLSVNEVL